MNTSQFMDKQIMDLSNSQNNNTFMDLTNLPPQEDHHHVDGGDGGGGVGDKKDEILPNYDFQPIRPPASSQTSKFDCSSDVDGTRVWNSAESNINSNIRNYGSLDAVVPANVIVEKDRDVYDADLISEIDRTMKKHADNLMHTLEGVSARLSQLESRSRHMENSVEDLKVSVGNNHGSTDGKLRQIENIIREVQAGVQVIKDKQEILEAQLQLSKVQTLKVEQHSETQIPVQQQQQQATSPPLQSDHHLPPAAAPTHSLPPTITNIPPPAPQNLAHIQHPNQFPHRDSYYPPSGQTPEAPPPHYQIPPPQQQPQVAAPPQAPHPQYQPPPHHMQYSQPPPMPQQHPTATQPPMGHHSEDPPNLQPQTYPPTLRQPLANPPPPQQFYGSPSQMYEPPSSRPGSGFSGQYGPSSGYIEPYGYGGGSPRKSQQHSSPNVGPGYPQLPTARILSHAVPTASAVGGSGSGSGSGSGPGNRVPIDDVVDKVTNMGFPRDQVRATVRKLTEDGQAVDLNVVLDKVMNDGVETQGPRGWFGR